MMLRRIDVVGDIRIKLCKGEIPKNKYQKSVTISLSVCVDALCTSMKSYTEQRAQ